MTTITPVKQSQRRRLHDLRLIWTLAAKDIVDALKNRSTLTAIVLSLLMVAFYRYFPVLAASGSEQSVLVYAPAAEVDLVDALQRSPALAVHTYDSAARMQEILRYSETPELGIIIPSGAAATPTGEPIVVDGYVMNWLTAAERRELVDLVETEMALSLNRPVTIDLTAHELYQRAADNVINFAGSTALVFTTLIAGMTLVPNLMIEEKKRHTLAALQVAPVNAGHIVAGKAVAGIFYGGVGCLAVAFVFGYLIVNWPLAILAMALSVLFMVSLGLLLGTMLEQRAQLQLATWFVVIPLLFPIVLYMLEGLVPSSVIAWLRWLPTVTMARIFSLSLANDAVISLLGPELVVSLALTAAAYGLLVVLVRRQELV